MSLPSEHFKKTKYLLSKVDKNIIAQWLLNEGYFPEQYVLPPSFKVENFSLQSEPYNKDFNKLTRRNLIQISYPKTMLTSRVFGIQHPFNYHDIVYYIMEDWENVMKHLFPKDLRIFSYSFPIPLNARNVGNLSPLRSGRMIYEWLTMAEKDLVSEAHNYSLLVRTDITNFYNSIYTHSISWALHGRKAANKDKDECKLLGNKIDRLIQYANDGKTNGIPVGPVLSDLISEIILTNIDRNVSIRLKDIDFIGTRFKDDYRILCNSESDAKKILKFLAEELISFNLLINETKTTILELPEGLYRQHDREYFPKSLKNYDKISFKLFEHTLLSVLNIHKKYPGTSIIEKFLGELYNDNYELKIEFSNDRATRKKQILKMFSLLFLMKRESEKILCHVLGVIQQVYLKYHTQYKLKQFLKELIINEIKKASEKESVFEISWYVFFSRYLKLGITKFSDYVNCEKITDNPFYISLVTSRQKIFNDTGIKLFIKPKDIKDIPLVKILAVFNRE